tara:strand:- start:444 stop:683 length:240 start_codon:yes stop_codon:yes gene_type:complete
MTDSTVYLDTNQLAERYGVAKTTVKYWRLQTKKLNKQVGPEWYEIPKMAHSTKLSRVRYSLDQVIAWEEENNITPKVNF